MTYILVLILALGNSITVHNLGEHRNLTDCMYQREVVVEKLGRPIVNYQAICVLNKHKEV